jgi:hypothetical protein
VNSIKRVTLSLLLFAGALSLATTRAAAEEVYKGTFSLGSDAYWGNTLLHPGVYSFWMNTSPSSTPIIYLTGEGTRVYLMSGPPIPERTSTQSYLTITNFNGTYVVQRLEAGNIGRAYTFVAPKSVRKQALRADASQTMQIPVSNEAGF